MHVVGSPSDVLQVDICFQVKRMISDDHRYDAVGSSSLREELFNTFLKANTSSAVVLISHNEDESSTSHPVQPMTQEDEQEHIRRRKERAVREREEKVKAERSRVETDIERSRSDLNKDESERDFRCAFALVHRLSGAWLLILSQEYA